MDGAGHPARALTAGARRLRVVLASPDPVVGEGLRSMLSGPGMDVLLQADSAPALAAEAAGLSPDVAVIDVRAMPKGAAALDEVRQALPQAAIIVLSFYGDPGYFLEAVAHGAACYLSERISLERLIFAIEVATAGLVLADRPAVLRSLQVLSGALRKRGDGLWQAAPTLTRREGEVLALAAQGMSNREIAQALTLADGTVRCHMQNILRKLGLRSRREAAMWAQEHWQA